MGDAFWNIKSKLVLEDHALWANSFYFVLKEIYYHDFLCNLDLEKFGEAIDKLGPKRYQNLQTDDDSAARDFKKRIKYLIENSSNQKYSVPEICQLIMTEQNIQNSNTRNVSDDKSKSKFKHYKLLLEKALLIAFREYFVANYRFLMAPTKQPMIERESFLKEYNVNPFSSTIDAAQNDIEMQKWYVVARLLNGKELNQLSGVVKTYNQYCLDVERRASQAGSHTHLKSEKLFDNILNMLDFCILLSGKTSNQIQDYFDNEDDYARYVSGFVNIDCDVLGTSPSDRLKNFSNREIMPNQRIGIYYDGNNPILNRNIVYAKLYGFDFSKVDFIKLVTSGDILDYYKAKQEISKYDKGIIIDADKQRNIKRYQNLANRVELRNVMEYAEIVNELQGQLINWSYLRERDLMYFQLGFHYNCLKNANCEKPDTYLKFTEDGLTVNNAILYQIVAMYTYGMSIWDGKEFSKKILQIGSRIPVFLAYTTRMGYADSEALYNAGLEMFEVISEHDAIIKDIRDYIDHFKYYTMFDSSGADKNRSMLDIYSDVFDRFFTYDMKYRKNVGVLLKNILARHFVNLNIRFSSKGPEEGGKKRVQIVPTSKDAISSMTMTYVIGENADRTVELYAKDKEFLADVLSILEGVRITDNGLVKWEGKYFDKPIAKNKKKPVAKKKQGGSKWAPSKPQGKSNGRNGKFQGDYNKKHDGVHKKKKDYK